MNQYLSLKYTKTQPVFLSYYRVTFFFPKDTGIEKPDYISTILSEIYLVKLSISRILHVLIYHLIS